MIRIEENISLLPYNTFMLDVKAKVFAEYETEDELKELLARYRGEHILHIGRGSNLLFNGDFKGVVLHSRIMGLEMVDDMDESVVVRVGAGVVVDDFIEEMVLSGFGGMENLSLIPGEMGAAAVQNIGAYGVEIKDVVEAVEAVEIATGEKRVFANQECAYGYRESIFKGELAGQYVVTAVCVRLQKNPVLHLDYGNIRSALTTDAPTIEDVRNAIIAIRNDKLPKVGETGSAGSFFKNPYVSKENANALLALYPNMPHFAVGNEVKIPAAWLIEQCGWKGKAMGKAGVWGKQPLVLVNLGGAKADELVALAEAIVKSVKEKFGIDIVPEANIID